MVPTGCSLGLGDTIQDTRVLYGIDTERYTYCMVPTLLLVCVCVCNGAHISRHAPNLLVSMCVCSMEPPPSHIRVCYLRKHVGMF